MLASDACVGQRIPTQVSRGVRQALNAMDSRKVKKAKALLKKVGKLAVRSSHGKKLKVTAACASAIRSATGNVY